MEYQEIKLLKESEKSTVHLVRETDGTQVFVRKKLRGQHPVYFTLKNCQHPCLPKLYDVSMDDDVTTVVEEYIEGKTPDKADLSEDQFLVIVRELCSVLEFIHGKGIIHRDIKPSNLLLTQEGHIYLIDFDTARVPKKDMEQDTRRLGTRGYAPPEQYGFSQTDKRADIYSMGITLEQLMGESFQKARYQKILRKCTNLDPDKRYQSVKQVKDAFFQPNKKGIIYGGSLAAAVILAFLLWNRILGQPDNEVSQQEKQKPTSANPEVNSESEYLDELFSKDGELSVLMAPTNPHWIEGTGTASWGNVLNSGKDGQFRYIWRLYRKDSEVPPDLENDMWLISNTMSGNSLNNYEFQLNLSDYFTENGFYYFAVSATGDNVNYSDSPFTLSDAFEYTGEEAPPLPAPTGLFWNVRDSGKSIEHYAAWSNLDDYADLDTFNVIVYDKDGEYVVNNMWTKEFIMKLGSKGVQISADFLSAERAPYRFTVQVYSSRPNEYKSSLLPIPPTEEYFSPEFTPEADSE